MFGFSFGILTFGRAAASTRCQVMAPKYTVALRQNNRLWQETDFLQRLLQQQKHLNCEIQS